MLLLARGVKLVSHDLIPDQWPASAYVRIVLHDFDLAYYPTLRRLPYLHPCLLSNTCLASRYVNVEKPNPSKTSLACELSANTLATASP